MVSSTVDPFGLVVVLNGDEARRERKQGGLRDFGLEWGGWEHTKKKCKNKNCR